MVCHGKEVLLSVMAKGCMVCNGKKVWSVIAKMWSIMAKEPPGVSCQNIFIVTNRLNSYTCS